LRVRPRVARLYLIGLPLLGLLSMPLSYLLLEVGKWTIVPQFQPARAVLFIVWIAIILASAAGIRAAERKHFPEAFLWLLLVFAIPAQSRLSELIQPGFADPAVRRRLLLIVLLAAGSAVVIFLARYRWALPLLAAAILAPFFLLPGYGRVKNYPDPRSQELDRLCSFAATSTPKDAVFLFPDAGESLHPGIFRVQTLRPVYVDWKSGGQVNYYRSVAEEWWMRWQATMTKTANAHALTPADLDNFAHLGIQYVVVSPAHSIAAVPPAYRNAKFVVYRLRDRNSSTSAREGTEACAPARVTDMHAAAFAKYRASVIDCPSASATASAALNVSPAAVVSFTATGNPGLYIAASPSL
jgi:hypothetical protein